jgi:hypothetical protein
MGHYDRIYSSCSLAVEPALFVVQAGMLTLAFSGGTAHTTEPHVDASSAFVAHGRPCSNSLSDRFARSLFRRAQVSDASWRLVNPDKSGVLRPQTQKPGYH